MEGNWFITMTSEKNDLCKIVSGLMGRLCLCLYPSGGPGPGARCLNIVGAKKALFWGKFESVRRCRFNAHRRAYPHWDKIQIFRSFRK